MSRPIISIGNPTSSEYVEREMNDEEFAELQNRLDLIKKEEELQQQIEAEAQAKRSVALAKLEALGLNEADLKALGL